MPSYPQSGPPSADLLLANARVLTMDPARPRAEWVAVTAGRIAAVGSGSPGFRAREVADLRGATLLPGFHDAHNHMAWFGLSLTEVDLRPAAAGSLDELYAAVTERAQANRAGRVGRSAPATTRTSSRRTPTGTRWTGPRPAGGSGCGTPPATCASSAARVLADLGLPTTRPEVPGGKVVTDAAGRPTGLLQERAQELVGKLVHPYPVSVLADAIDRAGQRYLAEGITSVTEAGIGGGWIGHTPVELAAYQAARDTGRLRVRVELMIASDVLHPLAAHPDDDLEVGLDLGIRTGFGDDWLRIGAMKIFTDGSLIGRTAAMHDDYADAPGNHGYLQAGAEGAGRRHRRGAPVRLAGRHARDRRRGH